MSDEWSQEAYESWVRYYVEAGRFDRELPGGWSPWVPNCWLIAPAYMSLASRHAVVLQSAIPRHHRECRAEMIEACHDVGRLYAPDRSAADVLREVLGE